MLTDFEDKLPAPPLGWRGRILITLGCLVGLLAFAQATMNLVGYATTALKWLV